MTEGKKKSVFLFNGLTETFENNNKMDVEEPEP
jgi:hypothetical protein